MNGVLMKNATFALLLSLPVGFVLATAFAHHSGSKYDRSRLVTIEGTIREFQWTNPHVIIWVNADADGGREPQLWAIQLTSPGNLRRNGWTQRSLEPGDRVRVDAHPLLDGGLGGGLSKITILDTGEELFHFGPQPGRE